MSDAIPMGPIERREVLRRILPFAAPFIFGAACYGAVAVPYVWESGWAVAVVVAALAVGIAGTGGLAAFAAPPGTSRAHRFAHAATPALLVAGTFLFLMLVESSAVRFVAVTGGMLLLTAFFARLDAGDDEEFANLSRAVRAVALFFLLAFTFGVSRYVSAPLPLMTAVATVALGVAAFQDLRPCVGTRLSVGYAAVAAVLGAELYLALAFLPTSYLTNAAVLLVAMEMLSSAMRNLAAPGDSPLLARRHVALALVLLAAIFGTARWF